MLEAKDANGKAVVSPEERTYLWVLTITCESS